VATRQQEGIRAEIAALEREAALLRSNAPAAEADQRERQAADHDVQAGILRENLEAEVHAERAQLVAARDRDLVRVRWVRDAPPEGALIDGRRYTGKGPVRQRQGQSATHTAAVAREVELQPGEVAELPRQHGEVLAAAGYVQVLESAAAAEVTG